MLALAANAPIEHAAHLQTVADALDTLASALTTTGRATIGQFVATAITHTSEAVLSIRGEPVTRSGGNDTAHRPDPWA